VTARTASVAAGATTSSTPGRSSRSTSGALLSDATRLGGVELNVTDLDRSVDFYTGVIGMQVHARGDGRAALGAGGEDLVTLYADPAARRPGRHAGLYHFALLFPTRVELARVGRRVAEQRVPIDGASDHTTHEAIYLPDPDGIGVELAADRSRDHWPDLRGGNVYGHGPAPLDIPDLFATIAGEPYAPRADGGLRVGHVHLHVGELDSETRFYRDGLGFEVITPLPSAVFVSAGGYHHHVAYNLWRGGGVSPAPASGVIGLRRWTLLTDGADEQRAVATRLAAIEARLEEDAQGLTARDPAGIAVLVR
jgi:catechol 2,3-dioxygenase